MSCASTAVTGCTGRSTIDQETARVGPRTHQLTFFAVHSQNTYVHTCIHTNKQHPPSVMSVGASSVSFSNLIEKPKPLLLTTVLQKYREHDVGRIESLRTVLPTPPYATSLAYLNPRHSPPFREPTDTPHTRTHAKIESISLYFCMLPQQKSQKSQFTPWAVIIPVTFRLYCIITNTTNYLFFPTSTTCAWFCGHGITLMS